MTSSFRQVCVFGALALSIAFGFLKQAKVAFRSIETIRASHQEAGARYSALKEQIFFLVPPPQLNLSHFSYISDDPEKSTERYYGFQYAIVPYRISNERRFTRYLFLDFETAPALKAYCREHSLEILFERGGLAVAKRGRLIP